MAVVYRDHTDTDPDDLKNIWYNVLSLMGGGSKEHLTHLCVALYEAIGDWRDLDSSKYTKFVLDINKKSDLEIKMFLMDLFKKSTDYLYLAQEFLCHVCIKNEGIHSQS